MAMLEPRLSDLRAGFGGYGYAGAVSMTSDPFVPPWHPTPGTPTSLCPLPLCPCSLPFSRSHLLSDFYDHSTYWWYLKSAQDQLFKGLPQLSHTLSHSPLESSHPDLREHINSRLSPRKELPTKLHKLERARAKERCELSRPPKYQKDHDHHQRNTPKSLHSSPPSDYYQNRNIEMYRVHHTSFLPNCPALCSPAPLPASRYPVVDLPSPHERPLNLTIGGTSGKYSISNGSQCPSESRPSVITCTSLTDQHKYHVAGSGPSSPSEAETSDICDPAIEEHFRRSLKNKYPEYLVKRSSLTPSPPPSVHSPPTPLCQPLPRVSLVIAEPDTNANVAGSVDDHFSRALGNSMWLALKPKNKVEEIPKPGSVDDHLAQNEIAVLPMPGSVDDHFTKALGQTWLQLKAEKEMTKNCAHSFPMFHPLPHSLTHVLPRSHILPHPAAQQPSSPASQKSSGSSLLST